MAWRARGGGSTNSTIVCSAERSQTRARSVSVSSQANWPGWIELAFLTGLITGPNGYPCPPDAIGIERFVRAWGTIAYHEILLILVLAVFIAISWGQLNPIAFWTFAILFGARITAKLNLFFGVPKINIEFLPTHLAHLPSHFRIVPQALPADRPTRWLSWLAETLEDR